MILQWAVNVISREEKQYARGLIEHRRIKSAAVWDFALLMRLFTRWDLLSAHKALEGRRCFCLSFSLSIDLSCLFFLFLCASRSHHASSAPLWIYITEFSNLSRSCDWTNNLLRRLLWEGIFFFFSVGLSFCLLRFSLLFSFVSFSSVSSLWESVMDVYIDKTPGWSVRPALPGL